MTFSKTKNFTNEELEKFADEFKLIEKEVEEYERTNKAVELPKELDLKMQEIIAEFEK